MQNPHSRALPGFDIKTKTVATIANHAAWFSQGYLGNECGKMHVKDCFISD